MTDTRIYECRVWLMHCTCLLYTSARKCFNITARLFTEWTVDSTELAVDICCVHSGEIGAPNNSNDDSAILKLVSPQTMVLRDYFFKKQLTQLSS